MTKEKLFDSLNFFHENETLGITVYAILKGEENINTPKVLDIKDEDLEPLIKIFIKSINDNITANDDVSVLPLSSSDERKNVVYEYDLETPEELLLLERVIKTDDIDKFNFTEDNFTEIKALLIEIGNSHKQIVLYKTIASINIFGRKNFFLKKADKRFEKIDDDFLRISSGFQLFRLDEKMFILNLETLEKFFGFHDIIKKEATQSLDSIKEMAILENPETLKELIDDVSFARKLTKVAKNSPVLKERIPNKEIIRFTKNHPVIKGKIKYNSDGSKIQLDTKVSKNLFVKLLNDDFLTSELTQLYYDSLAKDGILAEEVQESE